MARLVLAAQPVRPDRARVQLRVGGVQLRSDVGKAGRVRLGLLDDMVEDERAPEALLRRRLQQCGLESCEPGPADLVRAPLSTQELRGTELAVGDVHAHHLVGGTDPPVDRLREGQGVAAGTERPVRIVLHGRHQLAGRALGVLVQLPQARCGGHVEAAQGRDAGVVVDDRPRLPQPT